MLMCNFYRKGVACLIPFHKLKFNFTAICILSHFSCQTKHLLVYYRSEQLISQDILDDSEH